MRQDDSRARSPVGARPLPVLEVGSLDPYLPPARPHWKRSPSMPIYAYECGACGATHDILQKMGEGRKRKCPSCGELRLRKLVTAAAFHLKGTGWYVTDFRDKDKKKEPEEGTDKKNPKARASPRPAARRILPLPLTQRDRAQARLPPQRAAAEVRALRRTEGFESCPLRGGSRTL